MKRIIICDRLDFGSSALAKFFTSYANVDSYKVDPNKNKDAYT